MYSEEELLEMFSEEQRAVYLKHRTAHLNNLSQKPQEYKPKKEQLAQEKLLQEGEEAARVDEASPQGYADSDERLLAHYRKHFVKQPKNEENV
jgi:hypothetical protein